MSNIDQKYRGDKTKRLRDAKGRFRKKNKTPKKNQKNTKKTDKNKTPKKKKVSFKLKKFKLKKSKKGKTLSAKSPLVGKSSLPIAYGHVYSDGCGYCRDMQPSWDRLKENIGDKVELCDIGDNHSEGVRQFNDRFHSSLNFEGFPTVFKLKSRGRPVEYYDDYYKKQKADYDNGVSTIDPKPYRSQESMQVWVLGG